MRTYVYTYVCVYVCICMYVCTMCVYLCVCVYVCMYVCICVCVCIYGRIFYVNQPTILSMLFTLSSQLTCYIPGVRFGANVGWSL